MSRRWDLSAAGSDPSTGSVPETTSLNSLKSPEAGAVRLRGKDFGVVDVLERTSKSLANKRAPPAACAAGSWGSSRRSCDHAPQWRGDDGEHARCPDLLAWSTERGELGQQT
jgi:hypothetical protein